MSWYVPCHQDSRDKLSGWRKTDDSCNDLRLMFPNRLQLSDTFNRNFWKMKRRLNGRFHATLYRLWIKWSYSYSAIFLCYVPMWTKFFFLLFKIIYNLALRTKYRFIHIIQIIGKWENYIRIRPDRMTRDLKGFPILQRHTVPCLNIKTCCFQINEDFHNRDKTVVESACFKMGISSLITQHIYIETGLIPFEMLSKRTS